MLINLQDSFGQISVVLLSNLSLVGGAVEDRGVVIHVVDVDDDLGVVLVQIVRGHQSQLVLRRGNMLAVSLNPYQLCVNLLKIVMSLTLFLVS